MRAHWTQHDLFVNGVRLHYLSLAPISGRVLDLPDLDNRR
jgi:hypothetical protein